MVPMKKEKRMRKPRRTLKGIAPTTVVQPTTKVDCLNWIKKWELFPAGTEVHVKVGESQYKAERFGIPVWAATSWDDQMIIIPVGQFPQDLM